MKHNQAWQGLEETLGSAAISRDESDLEQFRTSNGSLPDAVARIKDLPSLDCAVNWARKHRVPLYASSSKPPHNDALERPVAGGLMLDLSVMDKVIKINRKNRVALFEAGVTFENLLPQIQDHALRTMLPLMPRKGKSVLASYLDREPCIYPRHQWDLSDPLLCVETVFGTGDRFTTGSAAGPGTIQQQWDSGDYQKSPMGPGQNDWMRLIQGGQGTIGLVTWCSAKCEIIPKKETFLVFGADSITPLVEASYTMFHQKCTDVHFMVDARAMAALVSRSKDQFESALKQATPWYLCVSVTGLEHFAQERAAYLESLVDKAAMQAGARKTKIPAIKHATLLDRLTTSPGSEPHWRDLPLGFHKRIYFQTTMDRVKFFSSLFKQVAAKSGIKSKDVATYVQPQLAGRCCHLEFVVAARNKQELARAARFCDHGALELIKNGAYFSRPHGAWAGPAMSAAGSAAPIFSKMKNVFDPDNIMAPGRLVAGGQNHA